jgi:hypothetical protein
MKPAAQHALRLFGFRDTLVWNGVISAVMIAICAAFRPTWPAAAIYAVLLVSGFFRSLQFTAYNTLAYSEIPRARMSAATSLYSTTQQLCQVVGISIGAATLGIAMHLHGHESPELGDFSVAFIAVAVVALLAAPLSTMMPRGAGDEVAGRIAPQRSQS